MLHRLREMISPHNPIRLFYHKALALLGAFLYRFPSHHLKVIAVTGTSGKSTTCHLIAEILQEAGYKVGLATTIGFRIGDREIMNDTKMTTVGRFTLQKLLRQMLNVACEYAVIEVTSHALTQSRLKGMNIDTAVMTNMKGDHIEYHGNFENYLHAKGRLFQLLRSSGKKSSFLKRSILNRDDPYFDYFNGFWADEKHTYGISHEADPIPSALTAHTVTASQIVPRDPSAASISASVNTPVSVFVRSAVSAAVSAPVSAANVSTRDVASVHATRRGISFRLHHGHDSIDIQLNLPGIFNVYNALAAASVALTEGLSLTAIEKALARFRSLPGRFESLEYGQPFSVVVDYAHTSESLQGLLEVYKQSTSGRLFVVFGAPGGGRDKSKRPKMGRVAHELADYIIVTSDDPYREDEWKIIEMICEGIPREEGDHFWKIANRRLAIQHAFFLAQAGDTVVIAGKGCEPVQMIYGERRSWDDRASAREILQQLS